jgi:hypothetical protein
MNFAEAIKELDDLYEAKRVISDVDTLYHYTNPTPFVKIFTEDCLRGDVHTEAVCLTTDRDYIIYDYPCGIQLSRKKLVEDGYELVPFDEFEYDTDGSGESEERIYGNINNLSKYVTAVYINWQGRGEAELSIVQSAEGDRIADAVYDEHGNELENYDLMLSDFVALLDKLKSKGIRVHEQGSPMTGVYYLDSDGKLRSGKLPAAAIAS